MITVHVVNSFYMIMHPTCITCFIIIFPYIPIVYVT